MPSSLKQTVVVALYPGCVSYDVALATELLARKYEIQTATRDGQPPAGLTGLPLTVNGPLSKIDWSVCRALLVPGGDVKSAGATTDIPEAIKAATLKGVFVLAFGEAVTFITQAGLALPPIETQGEPYAIDGKLMIARSEGSIDAAVELGARLDVLDAKFVTRTKDHYRGLLGRKIRALALALIKDPNGRYLFHQMFDAKKKQTFYRPVGGGIDFHEPARLAIVREIREELGFEIIVEDLVKTFENIFVIEDLRGHEMVSVFRARFKDLSAYAQPEIAILESGKTVSRAVWKTPAEIRAEGSALYPVGIEAMLDPTARN